MSRINVGWGLARLVLAGNTLELRLTEPFGWFAAPLRITPADVDEVFHIQPWWVLGLRGIGFTTPDSHEYYFKSGRAAEILPILRAAGFPVADARQPASKVWTMRR